MHGPGCLSLRVQNNLDIVPTVPEGLGIYSHVSGGLWLQNTGPKQTKVWPCSGMSKPAWAPPFILGSLRLMGRLGLCTCLGVLRTSDMNGVECQA